MSAVTQFSLVDPTAADAFPVVPVKARTAAKSKNEDGPTRVLRRRLVSMNRSCHRALDDACGTDPVVVSILIYLPGARRYGSSRPLAAIISS